MKEKQMEKTQKGKEVTTMKDMRSIYTAFFIAAAYVVLSAVSSHAGTNGAEFTDIYTTIQDWTTGYLGRTISIGAFLVGIAMGVVRQSIMAVVTGIATALSVNYAPAVIENVVQALI